MNKRGFTLIETMIVLALSLGTITVLLIIPNRMMESQGNYRHAVKQNLTNSTITLYLNEDLSQGISPKITDTGFTIGSSEYIVTNGELSRKKDGQTILLNEIDVKLNQTNNFIIITDKLEEKRKNTKKILNIKIPLRSKYYLEGGYTE